MSGSAWCVADYAGLYGFIFRSGVRGADLAGCPPLLKQQALTRCGAKRAQSTIYQTFLSSSSSSWHANMWRVNMKMNECESSPGSDFSLSLSVSPESSASERSGCKNQSGAMRQAAPQLANHRFEHQKRGGALRLPATLSKQSYSHAATLLSSTSPPLPAAHGCSHSALHPPCALPNFNLRQCGFC